MNQAKRYRNLLKEEGAAILTKPVFHHVIYERAFRCTLLPIPSPDESKMHQKEIEKLHLFANELMEIITADNALYIPDDFFKKATPTDTANSTSDSSNQISEREQIPSSSDII